MAPSGSPNGRPSSGYGARNQRSRRSSSRSIVGSAARMSVSSSSCSEASSRCIAAASRRNSSVFVHDSPSGGIAASLYVSQRRSPGNTMSSAFDLRRRREHDVGVAGRVGHELLVDDREQVVAGEATADQLGVGDGHQRVAVHDDEGVDLRNELGIGEPATHVDGLELPAGRPRREVGRDREWVDHRRSVRADERENPPPRSSPRAGEHGQASPASGRTSPRARRAPRR